MKLPAVMWRYSLTMIVRLNQKRFHCIYCKEEEETFQKLIQVMPLIWKIYLKVLFVLNPTENFQTIYYIFVFLDKYSYNSYLF